MSYPGFDDRWLREQHAKGKPLAGIRCPPALRAKYGNKKTVTSDGILCDSKKEAARWEALRVTAMAGHITDLMPHPSFPLYVNGVRTGRITFDALYTETGRLVCEDTKSKITAKAAAYRQRVRTFQACYPHITIREHI